MILQRLTQSIREQDWFMVLIEILLTKVEACYSLAMSSNRTFFPTKGVYLSALSTGSIDEVRNTSLRYAVMDIYERAYPRLVYNGEIYDERSDQVSWDGRQNFDPRGRSEMSLEYIRSPGYLANVRFIGEQNRIYVGLAESTLTELDAAIGQLPDPSAITGAEAVPPARENATAGLQCWQNSQALQ